MAAYSQTYSLLLAIIQTLWALCTLYREPGHSCPGAIYHSSGGQTLQALSWYTAGNKDTELVALFALVQQAAHTQITYRG